MKLLTILQEATAKTGESGDIFSTIIGAFLTILIFYLIYKFFKWFFRLFRKEKFDIEGFFADLRDYEYTTFPIKGINMQGTDLKLGLQKGYIAPEPENKYDKYAIRVVVGSKKYGYLPKGNKALYDILINEPNNMIPVDVKALVKKDPEKPYIIGTVTLPYERFKDVKDRAFVDTTSEKGYFNHFIDE